MKTLSRLALLLAIFLLFTACSSTPPQTEQDSTTILSDTLRESVELPKITAEEVMLSYPVDEPWTLTNGEGETLRYEGNNQFSGSIEILEKYPPGYTGYPPTHLRIRIPASNSFTFELDSSAQIQDIMFTVYDIVGEDEEGELFSYVRGTGISAITMDMLGTEVRGENLDCTVHVREYSSQWSIVLEAEEASYMSVFSQRGTAEATLDTDGINTVAQIRQWHDLEEPRDIPMTGGQPLKLTNLQAEDITLIEAEPYED